MTSISFTVPGVPVPQGSHKGFYNKALGRVMMVQDNQKLLPWRDSVTAAASAAWPFPPLLGPVAVTCEFFFPFRSQDLRKDGSRKRPNEVPWKSAKPDIDKLIRAVLDALTAAGIWRDDGQVCRIAAEKYHHEKPYLSVKVVPAAQAGEQKIFEGKFQIREERKL